MDNDRTLSFLLGAAYAGSLAPEHLQDLRKSGLSAETIGLHKIRSVPPTMIASLLGFAMPADVESALLFPFPDPLGGFMDYVKVKTFPDHVDRRGSVVEEHRGPGRDRYNGGRRKYLVRRRVAPRLYFPITTMPQALAGPGPVWLVEGMKKTLAAAQIGLPAVGIESAWGWRRKGSRALLQDFDHIALEGRIVELVPDSDVQTNPMIAKAMRQLADALRTMGATPRLVKLPTLGSAGKVGMDDFIVSMEGAR